MYVLGCATSVVFHFRLDEFNGNVSSTSTSASPSAGIFVAQALELSLLVGRRDSDEVGTFVSAGEVDVIVQNL